MTTKLSRAINLSSPYLVLPHHNSVLAQTKTSFVIKVLPSTTDVASLCLTSLFLNFNVPALQNCHIESFVVPAQFF